MRGSEYHITHMTHGIPHMYASYPFIAKRKDWKEETLRIHNLRTCSASCYATYVGVLSSKHATSISDIGSKICFLWSFYWREREKALHHSMTWTGVLSTPSSFTNPQPTQVANSCPLYIIQKEHFISILCKR